MSKKKPSSRKRPYRFLDGDPKKIKSNSKFVSEKRKKRDNWEGKKLKDIEWE